MNKSVIKSSSISYDWVKHLEYASQRGIVYTTRCQLAVELIFTLNMEMVHAHIWAFRCVTYTCANTWNIVVDMKGWYIQWTALEVLKSWLPKNFQSNGNHDSFILLHDTSHFIYIYTAYTIYQNVVVLLILN